MYHLGIETFLSVINEKSITSAAAKLHVAQSTISQRLQVLERETGMILLERSKGVKQIRLTPSGEEFYKLAEQWHFLQHQAQLLKSQGPQLSLSIGAVDSINTFLLLDVFRSLSKHQPSVQLTIKSVHSWDQYAAIESRQIDVCFSLQKLLYPNVIITEFFSSPMVVLSPTTLERPANQPIHPSELDPGNEISVLWGPEFKIWHDRWWSHLCPSHITSYYASLALAILSPPQWVILPLHIAKTILNRGSYSIYQLSDSPPDYICYMLTHKHPTSLSKQATNILKYYLTSHLGFQQNS